MAEVLIMERHAGLRGTLRRLLIDAGHTVLSESDGIGALTTLVQHPRPLVALLGDTADVDYNVQLFLTLLDVGLIPTSHAYILIAAERPRTLPTSLKYLCVTHHIPVVRTPIVIDVLLEAVTAAADRLQTVTASAMWPMAGDMWWQG